MIILIHPPVAKPCEPPAGIAKLSGMLKKHNIEHYLLDANIEGLIHILNKPLAPEKDDAWTKRAFRNLKKDLSSMKSPRLYKNIDQYKRAVSDISKVLSEVSPSGTSVGLANYENKDLSPIKSRDLIISAEKPELNPFYPFFKSRLEKLFREKNPSTVGISLNFLSQALSAFSIAGFIKKEFPIIKVIMGGGLVTSWLKNERWENPFNGLVDHFIAGPGEEHLLSILGIDATPEKNLRPEYSALPLDKYLSPGFILPYSASTGCYWNKCAFCPEKAEGNRYASIPSEQVISDIIKITAKHNPMLVHFLDNAMSPALLDDLSNSNNGFSWYGFARINQRLADPDFCLALKKAGCLMLKLGIESGDQGVLDSLQKGISVETASIVLKNLKKAGIATYVYLIFGTPAETEAGARKTLDFTAKHSDCIDFLNLAIFNMPVCGKTESEIEKRSFYEGDLSLYTDFSHPDGWDRKRVRLFLENEFKKHPSISAILKNDPPVFTSNHAPIFKIVP